MKENIRAVTILLKLTDARDVSHNAGSRGRKRPFSSMTRKPVYFRAQAPLAPRCYRPFCHGLRARSGVKAVLSPSSDALSRVR
jgi:hypothetical protein